VEIRAFVAQGTTVETIATAADEIAKYPQVAKVDVVTQSQALERARAELGEFKDVFESEFLPASMDIKLKPGFRDPTSVKAVAAQIHASRSSTTFASVRSGSRSSTAYATSPGSSARHSASRSRSWPSSSSAPRFAWRFWREAKRSRSCVSSARRTASSVVRF
jgi:hypothetical protein